MKISFTNTISQISDKNSKLNTSKILNAIGHDTRIGKKYLSLGALYSGPCFPRDNLNFSRYLKSKKLDFSLPKAIDDVNDKQLDRYINLFSKFNKLKNLPWAFVDYRIKKIQIYQQAHQVNYCTSILILNIKPLLTMNIIQTLK